MARHGKNAPSRRAKEDRAPSRRAHSSSSISPAMAVLSAVCVIALVAVLMVLSTSDRMSKPQNINGDFLGPESWETLAAYSARADESLGRITLETSNSERDEPSRPAPRFWALVTFGEPLDYKRAAASVEGVADLRVASIILGSAVTRDLPEPGPAAGRQQLIDNEVRLVAASAGMAAGDPRLLINGLIVYGDADTLKQVRHRADIAAVEALPEGAVRGRFGVRPYLGSDFSETDPVYVPGTSQSE
nr:hypothetical protein [Corynebacterium lactis]